MSLGQYLFSSFLQCVLSKKHFHSVITLLCNHCCVQTLIIFQNSLSVSHKPEALGNQGCLFLR